MPGAFAESLSRRSIEFTAPGCSTIKYFKQLGVLETTPLLIHGQVQTLDEVQVLRAVQRAQQKLAMI